MKSVNEDRDFTLEMLPINSKKQFGFVLKSNWKRFLFLGFILLLFSIPLIVSLLLRDFRAVKLVQGGETDLLFTNELFFAIFIIPSIVLLFVGLSGLFRIVRNYVWSEGILLRQDFLIGIKQNWLFFTIIGLIFSISYYISYLLSVYININFVRYIPFAIFFILIIPVVFIELSMIVIYKNSFLLFTFNSLKIYIKKGWVFLIAELVILLIPALLIVVPMPLIIKYIVLVFFILVLLSILCFAFQLLSTYIFDELINKTNHQEIYRKGLFNK